MRHIIIAGAWTAFTVAMLIAACIFSELRRYDISRSRKVERNKSHEPATQVQDYPQA